MRGLIFILTGIPMQILLQLRLLYTLRILVLIWMANIRIWVIVLLITSKKMTNSAGHLQKIWKAQLTELKVASTTPQ